MNRLAVSAPIRENVSLAPLTTLGIGGPARYFAALENVADIAPLIDWSRAKRLPWHVLGGGSNLLVGDAGYPGLVVHCRLRGIAAAEPDAGLRAGSVEVEAAAGEDWDAFVAWAVARGMAGIECLSGIPGTVGATPVQNVGAYGQEVDETIAAVHVWDVAQAAPATLDPAECGFGYRSSVFNTIARGRYIVTGVRFRLQPGAPATLRYAELQLRFRGAHSAPLDQVRAAVREIRRAKAMLLDPADPESRSAGSFFKNPILTLSEFERLAGRAGQAPPSFAVVDAKRRRVQDRVKVPAAWLIERAGFNKGFQLAGSAAALSSRHVLAIVNRGGATASDVLRLATHVQNGVESRFGINLQREPELLGFDDGDLDR